MPNFPINSELIEAPLDGEGKPLSRTSTGQFVQRRLARAINTDLLNQITNNGLNTTPLLEQDIETLINQVGDSDQVQNLLQTLFPQNQGGLPGSTLTPVPTSSGTTDPGGEGDSSDPDLNASITDITKMVGQQLWNYKVTFLNHEQPIYELAPHAIKLLCIEDSVLNWPLQGYIVIDARMEGFERSYADEFLHIRSDGRCEIMIEVWPSTRPEEADLPDDIWRIKFHGVIYDVEDMPHSNMTTKAKKLYFWDKKFQLMQEQTRQWSTATGKRFETEPPPEPIAHATDLERSMLTGEAIASLISDLGYEEYLDLENWDWGAGRICYCSKANWTVWDNIQYILQQHISSGDEKDICVLNWNRGTQKLELVPYWSLFEKAGDDPLEPGELQLEHLFFEGRAMGPGDENEQFSTEPFKAPYLDAPSTRIDIKSAEFNTIWNYQFVQTSGLDSSKAYVSKPVYSHWHRRKQFDCDVKENEIKYVKEEVFTPNYVEYLLGKIPVFVLNKTKTEQYSICPIHSPVSTIDPETDRYIRSVRGKGSTLLEGIYLNQCMVVRLKGSTHRIAGTFVAIDRLNEDSDTDYDYQICGQYFVANVTHLMRHQSYVTDLTLVKVNSYDKLRNTNEDIY